MAAVGAVHHFDYQLQQRVERIMYEVRRRAHERWLERGGKLSTKAEQDGDWLAAMKDVQQDNPALFNNVSILSHLDNEPHHHI